jgi:hypothetical protein
MAKTKDSIPAARVTLRQAWLVDCLVCETGVETEEGPFTSNLEAAQAKQRHLDEHARGEYS